MSRLTTDIETRLKEGGWELVRTGKHHTWRHPNGAVHSVSTTLRDIGIDRTRSMKEIAMKEQDPRRCTRNGFTETKEASVHAEAPSPAPVSLAVAFLDKAIRSSPSPILWWLWMQSLRESKRMPRADLALRMKPWSWGSSTVKKLESGRIVLTQAELDQWVIATGCSGIPTTMTIPLVEVDDPEAVLRSPRPPKKEEKLVELRWFEFLVKTRKSAQVTQNALAKVLGMTSTRLCDIEHGSTQLTDTELQVWSEHFQIRIPLPMTIPLRSDAPLRRSKPVRPQVSTPVEFATPVTVLATVVETDRGTSLAKLRALIGNNRLTDSDVSALEAVVRQWVVSTLLSEITI